MHALRLRDAEGEGAGGWLCFLGLTIWLDEEPRSLTSYFLLLTSYFLLNTHHLAG